MNRGLTIAVAVVIVGGFLVLGITHFIGKKAPEGEGTGDAGKDPKAGIIPVITEIKIEPPEPISTDFIRAVPVLANPKMRFVKFQYQWVVNSEEVPEGTGRLLDKQYYTKGDTLYCVIKGTLGKYDSGEVESDDVTVGNAPPEFKYSSVAPFQVPGEFRHQVRASDPDGDDITFTLLEPTDRGIDLDPETGMLTWYMEKIPDDLLETAEAPVPEPEDESAAPTSEGAKSEQEKISPYVKIVYEVRDSDGAVALEAIQLDLLKGTEIAE